MGKYINFSIFEIDYDKLLKSNHNDLTNLSAEDGNTITIKINRNDIDGARQEIQSYIDKDKRTFWEMIHIINFYITSGRAKFTDKMLDLFTNGPKPGNMLCVFMYTLDQLIFVHGVDSVALVYEVFGFDHNFYKYNPLPEDRINILKEGFKKYINPKFKYVEIIY